MHLALPDWLIAIAAVLTGILGSGRLTRLMYHDAFPPMVWLRIQWDNLTDRPGYIGQWNKLLHCPWCLSFWVTLACVGWYVGATWVEWLMWAWWVFWGTLAASYVATMVVVRDEPPED